MQRNNNYRIMPFSIERYAEVFALWQQCEGIGLSDADSESNIHCYLQRNPGMSFITLDRDFICGTILAGHDGRRGYIHHLAVHPQYRRQGIASQLADRAIRVLQHEGIGKCHLFIYTQNKNGIAFWESAGWTFRTEISLISKEIGSVSGDC